MIIYSEGGWTVARCSDGRVEWDAQHLHSVRAHEDQSGLVDANDYQIQGQFGRR